MILQVYRTLQKLVFKRVAHKTVFSQREIVKINRFLNKNINYQKYLGINKIKLKKHNL